LAKHSPRTAVLNTKQKSSNSYEEHSIPTLVQLKIYTCKLEWDGKWAK